MKSFIISLFCLMCFAATSQSLSNQNTFIHNYNFGNGTIKENVLKSYLSHAITMAEMCTAEAFCVDGPYPYKDDDVRMLQNIGAKFIGRSIYLWGGENKVNNPGFWTFAAQMINNMHETDKDIIFQACIFEIITTHVNEVKVPAWVFKAFNLSVENRNFRYDSMLNKKGLRVNNWRQGSSVPDVTRTETKLWFYYLAKNYIDIGIEAIHFGQVELMAMEDKNDNYKNWADILTHVRAYAAKHARRKMILCDGHMPGGGIVINNHLLFDFHSFPSRPKSLANEPQHAVLEKGYLDAFFGRSKGGITPSGWNCNALPYLVELDNFGISKHPDKPDSSIYVWGYDEISWFALQPENYRNEWLQYAAKKVKELDSTAFLEMPGSRIVIGVPKDKGTRYRANTNSKNCPLGYSQEETIKNIWKNR